MRIFVKCKYIKLTEDKQDKSILSTSVYKNSGMSSLSPSNPEREVSHVIEFASTRTIFHSLHSGNGSTEEGESKDHYLSLCNPRLCQ